MSSSRREPRIVVEFRGVVFILFLISISITMILFGLMHHIPALTLWGLVFLLAFFLSLIPILARVFAHKFVAEAVARAEFESELRRRIKEYESKHQEVSVDNSQ